MNRVLITGGSRGIGFAAAMVFARQEYDIIITGRNESELKNAAGRIDPDRCKYIVWDIADIKACKENILKAHEFFGNINTFINNAGIVAPKGLPCGTFPNMFEKSWDKIMDVNLKGTVFTCQEEAKYMIERSVRGHIVNVCSEMGFRAAEDSYGISKWGIRGFTAGAAKILAEHEIVMNGIAPGETATTILGQKEGEEFEIDSPRGKRAMPYEIAEEIYFLATRNNIIGEILISDGGRSIY